MTINDNELGLLFKNKIKQFNNDNANSELFIYNNEVLKIYIKNDSIVDYNISVVMKLLSKKEYANKIKELVLPNDLIIYNNNIVGFSMPYINGATLDEIIQNNLLSDDDIYNLFLKLLDTIERLEELTFKLSIGDIHEKNIIIDNDFNINIIDCDSFIIDNNKLIDNGNCLIGKYINRYFNNDILKNTKQSTDYFSLLCMVLNYCFKDIIIDKSKPISEIISDKQFSGLNFIFRRINNKNFILTQNDISKIFEFKNNFKYIKSDDSKVFLKEIERIRNINI